MRDRDRRSAVRATADSRLPSLFRFHLALALIVAGFIALAGGGLAYGASCRASWYGPESGRVTASGERFRPDGLTAAHRTWRFGTRLRVSLGQRSVVVVVNDRGPARWTGRCLDLSRGAARRLGMLSRGVATVRIEVLR